MKKQKPLFLDQKPEKMQIKRFDMSNLQTDAIIVIIGKRRVGKSWFIRDLMYNLSIRGMKYGQIYSNTEHASPFFKYFFPGLYIYKDFSETQLMSVIESQATKIKKNGKSLNNNMLIVFDDMLANNDMWKKSNAFRTLFLNGRHYNIMFIQSVQHVMGLKPELRENVDYAILYASDGENNIKKLYDNYGSVIPTFDMFKDIFYQCTRDRGCLIIDRTSTTDKWEDRVFFYKAKEPPKFRFGSEIFWKFHDENYESDDDGDTGSSSKNEANLSNIFGMYGANGKNYIISMAK